MKGISVLTKLISSMSANNHKLSQMLQDVIRRHAVSKTTSLPLGCFRLNTSGPLNRKEQTHANGIIVDFV